MADGVRIVVACDAGDRTIGLVTIDPRSGYLDQLCVAPQWFGKSVAGGLLDEAKRLSHGAVELDVNEANGLARRFYEREGFLTVSTGVSAQSGLPTIRMRWTRATGPAGLS